MLLSGIFGIITSSILIATVVVLAFVSLGAFVVSVVFLVIGLVSDQWRFSLATITAPCFGGSLIVNIALSLAALTFVLTLVAICITLITSLFAEDKKKLYVFNLVISVLLLLVSLCGMWICLPTAVLELIGSISGLRYLKKNQRIGITSEEMKDFELSQEEFDSI